MAAVPDPSAMLAVPSTTSWSSRPMTYFKEPRTSLVRYDERSLGLCCECPFYQVFGVPYGDQFAERGFLILMMLLKDS